MRIISGKFKGRKLTESSNLKDLRPTTDKNREALFNILSSAKFLKEIEFDIAKANVLDICCGTGAVAFEALSRGAKSAYLIDNNIQHLEIAKKNAQILGIENEVKFSLSNAKSLSKITLEYELIYIDPPYKIKASEFIKNLLENDIISKNSLVVIESGEDEKIEELKLLEQRKYGISYFSFYVRP